MSWEHAADARAALNAIVNDPEHGVAALSSAQTMSNLLKDLLPDAPREKSILVAAAEAGLADTLRDHVSQGMDANTAIRLTASSFSSSTPFTPEACNWVTGEIAGALGISQPGSGPGGGFAGGTPGGFDQQGAPTQMAPIPGYTPGQQPTQAQGGGQGAGGFGQGAGGFDPGATAPGAWPGGTQGLAGGGQQAGGSWQAGQPGQPTQAGYGAAGTGQPVAGGWQAGQPAQAGYGPAGTGQPAPAGWQQPQPGFGQGGFGQGGFAAGGGSGRSRRGLFIGLGIAGIVVIAIIVIVVSLGGKKNNNAGPGGHHSTSVSVTPSPTPPTPTPTPNPTGIENLTTIMSAPGEPIGKTCTSTPPTFKLNKATILDRRFCETTTTGVIIWGYQFDNQADFQSGFANMSRFVGLDNTTPATTCPPPSGSSAGKTHWFIKNSPRYNDAADNQIIGCLMNGTPAQPTLIWSMPTQNAFFVAKDQRSGATIDSIIKWWETIHYAQ